MGSREWSGDVAALGPGGIPVIDVPPSGSAGSLDQALDDAPLSRFHRRTVVVSGMGFFTDAYDLFVIGTVATLVAAQWHLGTVETSWVTGAAVLGAFVGALGFGRIADLFGRKVVYVSVAVLMIVGALGSAVAPDFFWLVAARFVLGLGIGGDYPVSAVLMSEYSNRDDRGRLVGLVFSMQALGLVVGPLVALALLTSGIGHAMAWRLLLGFGAVPAAAVVYLRSKMPESPRYRASVQGATDRAVAELATFTGGEVTPLPMISRQVERQVGRRGIGQFLTDRRMLRLVVGTAGSWFLLDYAYYGNTLSLPVILKDVDGHASLVAKLAWTLAIFVVFAVPGYLLAVLRMDRFGHRRLQVLGFAVMAVAFVALGAVKELTAVVPLFLAIFGLSYFFVEFGPNTTTFVLPSEVFPVNVRTTGHGIAAGIGKFGAFVGVFFVPLLVNSIGLRGMLVIAGGASLLGVGLTFLLPEPARRGLDEVSSAASSPARPSQRKYLPAGGQDGQDGQDEQPDGVVRQLRIPVPTDVAHTAPTDATPERLPLAGEV
ncbi:MAG: MFS transporter [Acidimicrobiales bacterium]